MKEEITDGLALTFRAKRFTYWPNLHNDGYTYYALCDIQDIPDNIPMETNPRSQKLSTKVAKTIQDSLLSPEENDFSLLSRGMTLSAAGVLTKPLEDGTVELTVVFADTTVHGDIDGGHVYSIILHNRNKLVADQQEVKIEIITGAEEIYQRLAAARNTSVQVQIESIAELYHKFDPLKEALYDEPFFDRLTFEENGAFAGSIDISDIIRMGRMMDIDEFPTIYDAPVMVYSQKQDSVENYIKKYDHYKEENNLLQFSYIKMAPLYHDFCQLWDHAELHMADYYRQGGGKHFILRGITKRKAGKPAYQTKFYQHSIDYSIAPAYIYLLVGAFRALLRKNDQGNFYWLASPIPILDKLGPTMVNYMVDELRRNGGGPNELAKNKNVWLCLTQTVQIEAMQLINTNNINK